MFSLYLTQCVDTVNKFQIMDHRSYIDNLSIAIKGQFGSIGKNCICVS